MLDNFREAMANAYLYASSSPDPSTQNGAVLLNANGTQLGYGCNDFPSGVDRKWWNTDNKQDKYNRVVHAEVSAILNAARSGYSTFGAILVCPWAACSNCSKHIAAAGIKTLVRHKWSNSGVTTGSHWYEDCRIGDEIMIESGIQIVEMDPVPSDIELRRDGKLWSVGASKQDELHSSV